MSKICFWQKSRQFVRHQFKSGFLNELKRDPHAAYKHYQQAYNLLMEVRIVVKNSHLKMTSFDNAKFLLRQNLAKERNGDQCMRRQLLLSTFRFAPQTQTLWRWKRWPATSTTRSVDLPFSSTCPGMPLLSTGDTWTSLSTRLGLKVQISHLFLFLLLCKIYWFTFLSFDPSFKAK